MGNYICMDDTNIQYLVNGELIPFSPNNEDYIWIQKGNDNNVIMERWLVDNTILASSDVDLGIYDDIFELNFAYNHEDLKKAHKRLNEMRKLYFESYCVLPIKLLGYIFPPKFYDKKGELKIFPGYKSVTEELVWE